MSDEKKRALDALDRLVAAALASTREDAVEEAREAILAALEKVE